MNRIVALWRDTRHLWVLLILVVGIGAVALMARARMVPESYGETGPYRARARDEIAAKPSVLIADATCLECHADVGEERAESLHKAVRCFHCHGVGHEHVALARKAAENPDLSVPPAAEWDGNFRTDIDLYVTEDRATCLACHQAVVGMPEDFKKINVAEHLENMGASETESRETCFECHAGHDTAP